MEFDIGWIFFLFIIIYLISRYWKDIRISIKAKKYFQWELDEVMNNDKYKVKGKYD